MKSPHLARHKPVPHLTTAVFNSLSRYELVTALSFMHRILGADRRRDLERLAAELPQLFTSRPDASSADSGNDTAGSFRERPAFDGERTYHLFNYFFSCLTKAQDRMERAQILPASTMKVVGHLTPRELSVLLWMKEGKTNWEIARILFVSERTVRFHVEKIFDKLDVNSRAQAVARAMGAGLIAS
jgi:DNA-binding CsgD family transcriptional regulator